METWEAITSRRNVRNFTDQSIPEADLERILEAARRTPSSGHQQARDFVVFTDPAQLEELSKVWRGAGHVARSAATVALVAPKTSEEWERDGVQYDLGQATMAMMLAAADVGLGTAHGAVSDQVLAQRIIGFPDDRFCAWLLSIGYPADRPLRPIKNPKRRPFDEVIHRGGW